MSDVAIRVSDLRKVYRLYKRPTDRLLDVFGLLKDKNRYSEHSALDGINLTINRGEKVAIIGRNGAGKSTLLKLVTQAIEPTSGTLETYGEIQALLQIGTGFHPEFTGRDNVISYLAQLGISGERANVLTEEIISFAELEEYIDQPVKTYSTGMGARLMFAASTAIEPDVLVIDEVLGVGDAYFARKSFERIEQLCEEHSTTLLLVSHDVYAASMICDRMVWIDQGRKLADGVCSEVMSAYERSIRRQEELRINRRAIVRLKGELEEAGVASDAVVGRIADAGDIRSTRPDIYVSHLTLLIDGKPVEHIAATAAPDESKSHLVLDPNKGNWGDATNVGDRAARLYATHGSIFHRLPFAFVHDRLGDALNACTVEIEIGCWAAEDHELECVIVHPELSRLFGARFILTGGDWEDCRLQLIENTYWGVAEAARHDLVRYGGRQMEITDVRFLDASGTEQHIFDVGSALTVNLDYQINEPSFDERPVIIVAFQKDGSIRTHRFWHDGIHFGPDSLRKGTIEIAAIPLLLGAGRYLVTISVFEENYFQSAEAKKFFATNDGCYDMHARGYELVVAENGKCQLFNDAIFTHPCRWMIDGKEVAPPHAIQEKFLKIEQ